MRHSRFGIAIGAGLYLAAAHPLLAAEPPAGITTGPAAQSSFLKQLAGSGGSVLFRTGRFADGTPGWFHLGPHPETGVQVFEAEGSIELKTPDFGLKSGTLDFQMESGILGARRDVFFTTAEIEARCQSLQYDKAAGSALLSGQPDVLQKSAANISHFTGMETFAIRRGENGEQVVELAGPQPIQIEMKSAPRPADGPDAPAPPAPEASGLARLGSNLSIQIAPAGEKPPRARAVMLPGGEMSHFNAAGSTVLKSDTFNLRCDEMTYTAAEERFEAVGNVYFRQDTIESDCGRMLYDLATGRVTLTGNPDVRRYEAGGFTHITNYDVFIIEPRPGGQPYVEGVGDGQSYFTSTEDAPKPPDSQILPPDTPIRLDSPPRTP